MVTKLLHSLWSGNTGKYSALETQYCTSLPLGQYCHSWVEYFPVLPPPHAIMYYIYYCMSGRAIQENIQLERQQYWPDHREGQNRVSRAEYFPVLSEHSDCNNLFIISMTFSSEKVMKWTKRTEAICEATPNFREKRNWLLRKPLINISKMLLNQFNFRKEWKTA